MGGGLYCPLFARADSWGLELPWRWTWAFFVVLPPRDFNNTVRLGSSASLDYFRFFAFEWLQGWFSLNLNGQLILDFCH